jgi:lauroyl/myristoyl acyltransferase
MKRYVSQLENTIRHDPANWLWSHKRWKNTRN